MYLCSIVCMVSLRARKIYKAGQHRCHGHADFYSPKTRLLWDLDSQIVAIWSRGHIYLLIIPGMCPNFVAFSPSRGCTSSSPTTWLVSQSHSKRRCQGEQVLRSIGLFEKKRLFTEVSFISFIITRYVLLVPAIAPPGPPFPFPSSSLHALIHRRGQKAWPIFNLLKNVSLLFSWESQS